MTKQMPHIRLRPLINDTLKWKLLADHLGDEINSLLIQLETCELEKLAGLQGQIRSYRTLLNLKATLTAERQS